MPVFKHTIELVGRSADAVRPCSGQDGPRWPPSDGIVGAMTPDLPDNRAGSRVHASLAVQALIGAESVDRLRGETYRAYSCCRCGQPGHADTDPAIVIVQRYRSGVLRARLAHARCAGSQGIEADADTLSLAGLGGTLSKAAVLQYPSPPPVRPLLILEPRTALSERPPAAST
jgi:hypothetical protein